MTVRVRSEDDPVNHPSHYTAYHGIEVIDLTEQMNFNKGNAVKYIARAGLKDPETEIQDLEKAAWYINREIQRLRNLAPATETATGPGIEGAGEPSANSPSTTAR